MTDAELFIAGAVTYQSVLYLIESMHCQYQIKRGSYFPVKVNTYSLQQSDKVEKT